MIFTGDLGYKDTMDIIILLEEKRILKLQTKINLDDIEFLLKHDFPSKCITSNDYLKIKSKNFDEKKKN